VLARAVRGAIPDLPRPAWILQAGVFASTVGNGAVTPFLLIYLHAVRGFSLETAGLAAGSTFVVAIAGGLWAGMIVDRFGARGVGAAALLLLAAGYGALPLVREPWHAFALLGVSGIGLGAYWPAYSSLLAAATRPDQRPSAYAVQRVLGNLGVGLGALAGGFVAATSDPRTFTILFVADAASYVVFAASLALVPIRRPEPAAGAARGKGSYRQAVTDRGFVGLVVVNGLLLTAGIAQLNSTLPLFAVTDAGVSERAIGLIFFVNAATIVVAQLPINRAVEARRRMVMLAIVGVIWGSSWLVVLAAGESLSAGAVALALVLVGAVFALGECIHGVVVGPLVADLAPEESRGRYMALWLTTAQLGFGLGPPLGALLLAWSPVLVWAAMAAVCLVMAATARLLESQLPLEARASPAATHATA
jgi:MFS family permease